MFIGPVGARSARPRLPPKTVQNPLIRSARPESLGFGLRPQSLSSETDTSRPLRSQWLDRELKRGSSWAKRTLSPRKPTNAAKMLPSEKKLAAVLHDCRKTGLNGVHVSVGVELDTLVDEMVLDVDGTFRMLQEAPELTPAGSMGSMCAVGKREASAAGQSSASAAASALPQR